MVVNNFKLKQIFSKWRAKWKLEKFNIHSQTITALTSSGFQEYWPNLYDLRCSS